MAATESPPLDVSYLEAAAAAARQDGEHIYYNEDGGELDSLPSTSTADSSNDSDLYTEADSDAQAEWERSLEQLQLLLTMMIVPWVGKYFGRKFAYWSTSFYSLIAVPFLLH